MFRTLRIASFRTLGEVSMGRSYVSETSAGPPRASNHCLTDHAWVMHQSTSSYRSYNADRYIDPGRKLTKADFWNRQIRDYALKLKQTDLALDECRSQSLRTEIMSIFTDEN